MPGAPNRSGNGKKKKVYMSISEFRERLASEILSFSHKHPTETSSMVKRLKQVAIDIKKKQEI